MFFSSSTTSTVIGAAAKGVPSSGASVGIPHGLHEATLVDPRAAGRLLFWAEHRKEAPCGLDEGARRVLFEDALEHRAGLFPLFLLHVRLGQEDHGFRLET